METKLELKLNVLSLYGHENIDLKLSDVYKTLFCSFDNYFKNLVDTSYFNMDYTLYNFFKRCIKFYSFIKYYSFRHISSIEEKYYSTEFQNLELITQSVFSLFLEELRKFKNHSHHNIKYKVDNNLFYNSNSTISKKILSFEKNVYSKINTLSKFATEFKKFIKNEMLSEVQYFPIFKFQNSNFYFIHKKIDIDEMIHNNSVPKIYKCSYVRTIFYRKDIIRYFFNSEEIGEFFLELKKDKFEINKVIEFDHCYKFVGKNDIESNKTEINNILFFQDHISAKEFLKNKLLAISKITNNSFGDVLW